MIRIGGCSLLSFVRGTILSSTMLSACLASTGTIHADELRYSLGSIQEGRELHVSAGGEARTTLAFYNIDGNVPTVVAVSVAEVPSGWRVLLEGSSEPPESSGMMRLLVEPTLPQEIETECRGISEESLYLPPRGWICADVVHVRIEVPGSTAAGTHGVVRVVAYASWDAAGGSSTFPQEREFLFDITVDDVPKPPESVELPSESSADPGSRAPLLVTGGICLGGLLLTARRALAKSGRLA